MKTHLLLLNVIGLLLVLAALSSCDQIREFAVDQAGGTLADDGSGAVNMTVGVNAGFAMDPGQLRLFTFDVAHDGWYYIDLQTIDGYCWKTSVSSSSAAVNYDSSLS